MSDHSHQPAAIRARIAQPPGRGVLRDLIYGGIDGAVTTFAIIAGVAGAGLSPLIIIALGLANVIADGFSMAASAYSGAKADQDNIARLRGVETRHIALYPEGERAELREILRAKGLEGDVLEAATDAIAARQEKWIDLMIEGEYGLGATDPAPLKGAVATFLAFLAAGVVPLVPFLIAAEDAAFPLSAALALAVLFAIGAVKSAWSLAPWWRSGLETFVIGGTAAALAYAVGSAFAH